MIALLVSAFLQPVPTPILQHEVVHFKPKAGYHFSPGAPQNCGGRLIAKSPRQLKCQYDQVGTASAVLNVCDNKETACRPLHLKLKVVASGPSDSRRLDRNQPLNAKLMHKLVPGFVEGEPAAIKAQALKNGKPVFVLISTDWCPECNEAKEFLLSSEMFQKVSAGWFKVYVDGDGLSAAKWEKLVPYEYYPSFVLLNSHMQEVARYTGPLRRHEFEKWAGQSVSHLKDPIPNLKRRVLARRAGSWRQRLKDMWHGVHVDQWRADEARLMKWAMDANQRDLFKQLQEGHAFQNLQEDIAEFQLNNAGHDHLNKHEKIVLYETALKGARDGDEWAENLDGLCGVDLQTCKAHLSEIAERVADLEKPGDLTPSEQASRLGDAFYNLSDVYKLTGQKSEAKTFAEQCAAKFEAMKAGSVLKMSRVASQGEVVCLELSGQYNKAESILNGLIKTYPFEPTFLERMARLKLRQKNPKGALKWIARAEGVAYGYNWFSLQLMKAKTLVQLKQKSRASHVLAHALAEVRVESGHDVRDQQLVARLRHLQTQIH